MPPQHLIVRRFETDWRKAQAAGQLLPRPEDYLADTPDSDRVRLLRDLLLGDLELRVRAGEKGPCVARYLERLPEVRNDLSLILRLINREIKIHTDLGHSIDWPTYQELVPPDCRGKLAEPMDRPKVQPFPCPTPLCRERVEPAETPEASSHCETCGPLRRIGPYVLGRRPLGKGGFGVVYRAYDITLGRFVALKFPKAKKTKSDARVRFEREAQIAARLRHERLVTVYHVDRDGDTPYIVYPYLEGGSLDEWSRKHGAMPPLAAADLFRKVAEGVHCAHLKQLVHQDLKPSNILLDDKSQPHVTDFGLALPESTGISSGTLVGTLDYMAPEQLTPGERIDARTDVYALGVGLCHLLTGRLPSRTSSLFRRRVVRRIRGGQLPTPRQYDGKVPVKLDRICCKAMTRDPAQRYGTAQQLADDLNNFLQGRPVVASPEGPATRVTRGMIHRRALVFFVLAVAAVALAVILGIRLDRSRQVTELGNTLTAGIDLQDWSETHYHELVAIVDQARQLDPKRATELDKLLDRALDAHFVAELNRPRLEPERAALLREKLQWIAHRDKERAEVLGTELQQRLSKWEKHFELTGPDFWGLKSVLDSADVQIQEGRLARAPSQGLRQDDVVFTQASCPENATLEARFAAGWEASPHLGVILNCNQGHNAAVTSFAITRDGKTLATGGGDALVKLWDLATRRVNLTLRGHKHFVVDLRFSHDGRLLASASGEAPPRLWDVTTGRELLLKGTKAALAVDFAPDGATLAATNTDGSACLWDLANLGEPVVLRGHKGQGLAVAFSPNGATLATLGLDQTVRFWKLDRGMPVVLPFVGRQPESLFRTAKQGRCLAFAPDSNTLAVGCDKGTIQLWDVAAHRARGEFFQTKPVSVLALGYAPDGKSLATGCGDGFLRVWNAQSRILQLEMFTHPTRVNGLAHFAGSPKLATMGGDGIVKIWDSAAQKLLDVVAARGYVFLLSGPRRSQTSADVPSMASHQQEGGLLRLRILRDGSVLRERALRVPIGPLTLRARRDGDRLEFQLNADSEILVYHEDFPLPGDEGGVFGLIWPAQVQIERLQAFGKARPARPTRLELAEAACARGHYDQAREAYEVESRSGDVGAECRCKLALCYVALGRTEEAMNLFRQLANESDRRWSVVANCQLALIYLRDRKLTDAYQQLTVLGQQPREQLAQYVSTELRRQILTLYYPIVDTPAIFKPDPDRVPTLKQAVVDAERLNVPAETVGMLKVLLLQAYHAEASPPHIQLDPDRPPAPDEIQREKLEAARARGEDFLRDPAAEPWLKVRLLREITWLHLRMGTPEQGLALLQSYLDEASGPRAEYLSLLLQRSLLRCAQNSEKEALADLDTLFRQMPPDDGWFIEASLLRGFLLDNPKGNPAARDVWQKGRDWARVNGSLGSLCGSMLAGLSGPVTHADAQAIRASVLPRMDADSFYIPLLESYLPKEKQEAILTRMWQEPPGRACARAIALRQVSFVDYYRLQLVTGAIEGMRQFALPEAKYDALLWQLASDLYNGYVDGRLTEKECLMLAATMVGQKPFWYLVQGSLGKIPGVRARMAFVLAHSYLRRGDRETARTFLQIAYDEAQEDYLRTWARQQLDELKTR
jgi:tetratricopeptide (TPR) repeat protein